MALNLPDTTADKEIAVIEDVEDVTTNSIVPQLDEAQKSEARGVALDFVKGVKGLSTKSPEFAAKLADIQNLAANEIERSGEGSNRMLERASTSVAGSKKSGGDAQIKVANTLAELRNTVEDLTPNPGDLSPARKILGFIPGGNKVAKYFQKYESAQVQLNGIIKGLMLGQDELQKDNASLQNEKANLWDVMGKLNQYAFMASEIDAAVAGEIETLKNKGDLEGANALESDVLFPVRQRHQDILTQIAVSIQGYLAMDLVRKNNFELIKGVDRARTTTVTALRTAIIVAQALSNQKLVLDQIDAVNTTTNNVIANTSAMLKEQTARIHQQASSSGVSVETLEKAFDDVFATMDAIDTFKVEANASMAKTVGALEGQINRTRPYLERTRKQELEANGGKATASITR